MSDNDIIELLTTSAEAVAAGLSALAEAITEQTRELQLLRREIATLREERWPLVHAQNP